MKALCIPSLDGYGDIPQWTVITFDDTFATRYAALCNADNNQPSEGAGHDTDALVAR